jgi:hypothetical protein
VRPCLEVLEDRLAPAAPVVSTGAAVLASSGTQATLSGTVNPEGSTTTARFQYSTDPTFTPTVATTLGSGFLSPQSVAVDAAGDVFVADFANAAVKEILPNGTIKTIGSGFSGPEGVAVDAAGDVFLADTNNNTVKEVLPDGTIKTIGFGFRLPVGVAVDAAGDVFVGDFGNGVVKEVLPNGTIKTIGSGFSGPHGVAVDAAGDVFVADFGNSAVKEALPNGTIKTIGSGFRFPGGVAVDAAGDVFVADTGHSAVKEVLPDGTIKTIGSGFSSPNGVAVDAAGDVFVADTGHNRVVELSPTVAATPSPLTGSQATAVSATLTGLTPDTTYYYRVVASNPDGTVADSSVQSFTTPDTPTVNVTDAGGTYNGKPFGANATAIGVDGTTPVNGNFTFTYYSGGTASGTPLSGAPSNTGTYTVVAAFSSSDTNYSNGTAQTTFTISAATPTLSVTDAGGTYNGNPFSANATALGVNNTPVSGSFSFAYYAGSSASGMPLSGAPSNVGIYTVVAAFTSSDPNYSNGTPAQTTFTITPAAPTVSVTDAGGTYNGNAFPASATVNGGSSLEGVPVTLDYQQLDGSGKVIADLGSTAPSTAGSYQVIAAFAGSTDYAAASASAAFSIGQATPTVSVSDAGGIYDGSAFPATDSVAGVVAGVDSTPASTLEGVAPILTYYTGTYTLANLPANGGSSTAPSVAGTYTVVASFAGSTDYSSGQALATFTIAQASPIVSVSDADGTYDGSNFPANATVNGGSSLEGITPTLTYYQGTYTDLAQLSGVTPLSSPPTAAGTYTVVASFAGSTDYSSGNALANFTIAQATPTVSVTDAGGTYNGNAFPATASVAGVNGQGAASLEGVTPILTYYVGSGTAGTNLGSTAPTNAGTYTAVASFAGSNDYSNANAQITFTIAPASASIQFSNVAIAPTLSARNHSETETISVHVSSPSGPVTQGTVQFTVDGQSVNAPVDAHGDATANLTVPLKTTDAPQNITATFSDPNFLSDTVTQIARWTLFNRGHASVDTFAADGSQSVQSFLDGQPWLDFLYTPSGQLQKVVFGSGLLSWDFRYFDELTVVTLDGVLPVAAMVNTPQGPLMVPLSS